jgi:hypothetical protein
LGTNTLGYFWVVGGGCVGVVAYWVAQCYPEWFAKAFNLKLDQNCLLAGLLIGASTVIIIKSNLITLAKMPIGGEYIHSLTRARVVFVMNKRRGLARQDFLQKQKKYTGDTTQYPHYFTKMETYINSVAPPLPTYGSLTTEITNIKSGPQTPDNDVTAREALTGVMYDYLGPKEVDAWGQRDGWGR